MTSGEGVRITRLPNWDLSEGDKNVQTLRRRGNAKRTVLQLSFNRNPNAKPIEPALDPVKLATEMVAKTRARIERTFKGDCAMGKLGGAVFVAAPLAYGEAWVVTDGIHVCMATLSCEAMPSAEELEEVKNMVTSVYWET